MFKNIIQTNNCNFNDLPQEAHINIKKWQQLNPNWKYLYFDEDQRLNFVKEHFDKECLTIYKNLPLDIMKANLFRYMSLYIHGGLYADLDMHPSKPINHFIKESDNFVVVADHEELELLFCIQVIYCSKNNKIMKNIIQTTINTLKNNNDIVNRYYVLNTTELPFSDVMKKILDPDKKIKKIDRYIKYNESDKAKEHGFRCLGDKKWKIENVDLIIDCDGAKNWNNYTNWWKSADEYNS